MKALEHETWAQYIKRTKYKFDLSEMTLEELRTWAQHGLGAKAQNHLAGSNPFEARHPNILLDQIGSNLIAGI